jgi:starch-binding outer membrane protein, SusD/RagB family
MKNIKIIYIVLAGILILSSCTSSFLDEAPSTSVDAATSIKTANDLTDAVNGLYTAAKSSSLFGRDVQVLGDILADNAFISSSNYGRFLVENAYTFSASSGSSSGIWSQGYYTILQANRIISSGLPSNSTVDQLRGEAYTIRGLTYLVLVNFFGTPYTINPKAPGVPIVTIPTYKTGPYLKPSRNTVAEVYDRIITDLDSAFLLMPGTSIASTYHATNSNYIAKYAARAIEARAFLYKGDYQKAREAALDVVKNGGYTFATSANAFSTYWSSFASVGNKLETILELNNSVTSNNGGNGLDYMYSQAGYGDLLGNAEVYNLYTATDYRKSLILNGVRKGNSQKAFVVNKYPNVSNTDRDEVKIIRYAEVVLTLAEAYARTNDEPNALVYLNQVAKLRDPSFTGYSSAGQQLLDDILNERRKELAFEGLRLFDLTRLNLVINRPVQPFSYTTYTTVLTTDTKRVQPIPQGETDANPNIVQNPGY